MVLKMDFSLKPCVLRGLIFFLLCTTGCNLNTASSEITIRWQHGQATAIYIPRKVVTESDLQGNIHQLLPVRLAQPSNQKINILGEYSIENDQIIFEPLIPFTR